MQNRKANNVGEGKGGVPLQMVEYGETTGLVDLSA